MSKKTELIANIILIVTGIVGGTLLFISEQKDLSTVFFAIALSSILYQFLGGIGDNNSFSMGAIKFGGAAAILIGFMFFLKKVVFLPDGLDQQIQCEPSQWIPISAETGQTLAVAICNGSDTLQIPPPDLANKRQHQAFRIKETAEHRFGIHTATPDETCVGSFNLASLQSSTLFNQVGIDEQEKRIQIFELHPDDPKQNSTNDLEELDLPFEIQVFNKSRFKILKDNQPVKGFENLEVVARTAYVVTVTDQEYYLVYLEQAANVVNASYPQRYSKWLVKKIKTVLKANP